METTPVIACCWLPGFALRIVAHGAGGDLAGPVALASEAAAHPVVLDCTDAARAHGVTPGMLVSHAMGCCSTLEVLGCDVPRVEQAAERFVVRLEAMGAAVQLVEPGRVYFDAAPLQLLYGGIVGVFDRVLGAFRGGDVRLGAGPNPFVSWVGARHAAPGGWLRVEPGEARRMLARMPIDLLPAGPDLVQLLRALGLATLGDIAALEAHHVADRFGAEGLVLRNLARGEDPTPLETRVPIEPVSDALAFPEAVANEQTLESAVELLAQRLVQHPRCVLHAPRSVVLTCALATGGSWQARRALRVPTLDVQKHVLAIRPALAELPGPVERMEFAFEQFALREARQRTLLDAGGSLLTGDGGDEGARSGGLGDERVRRGMRHVLETVGEQALLQVLEVEPWSRVPERHAVLVPRRVGAEDAGTDADLQHGDVGRGVWR
ncbi:MAG: DNA polymerase Y family protein [Thermoleophilia bacterium]|nr:DNA polymerase Y family protein [Thermoleophilia bacterium]